MNINFRGKAAQASSSNQSSDANKAPKKWPGPTENWQKCVSRREGIEIQRNNVQHNLREIHQHLTQLRRQNWSSDMLEAIFDFTLMPSMIKAEKKRNPKNTVVMTGNLEAQMPGQAILQVQGTFHYIAADIREINGCRSIVLFDSLADSALSQNSMLLGKLIAPFDRNDRISIYHTGQQKSFYDCLMFALSTSSKMSKSGDFLNTLHHAHFTKSTDEIGRMTGATLSKQCGPLSIFTEMNRSVPAVFLKHSQTVSVLNAKNSQQTVNASGQTFQQRFNHRTVERARISVDYYKKPGLQSLKFSTSIEDKRKVYLERVMAYIQNAPADDVTALAQRFNDLRKNKNIRILSSLQPLTRSTGPGDQMSLRLNTPSSEGGYSQSRVDEAHRLFIQLQSQVRDFE